MHVNIEFLGKEAIENVITSMNFKMDKTIFFGYEDVIEEQKKRTQNFLTYYCGVKKVSFIPVPEGDLSAITAVMRAQVQREKDEGNQVFFDITGGESLILVAYGILAKEFRAPIHVYDVEKDELIELERGDDGFISEIAKPAKIKLNLDMFIEMQGGVINYQLHKDIKGLGEEHGVINQLWNIFCKYNQYWNSFSDFLKKYCAPEEALSVTLSVDRVQQILNKNTNALKSMKILGEILDSLAAVKVITKYRRTSTQITFCYGSPQMQQYLWDGGSILELHTFELERKGADDCKIGVHIDWDGVIHEVPGTDVLNEIDVLSLHGNVPTFISCKSGKMGANQSLYAMYELETVTERFGGKYAKKALVTAKPLGPVYMARAKEMKIENRYE